MSRFALINFFLSLTQYTWSAEANFTMSEPRWLAALWVNFCGRPTLLHRSCAFWNVHVWRFLCSGLGYRCSLSTVCTSKCSGYFILIKEVSVAYNFQNIQLFALNIKWCLLLQEFKHYSVFWTITWNSLMKTMKWGVSDKRESIAVREKKKKILMHICPHEFFNRCKSNLPSVLHIVVNALCLRTHHNILAIIVKLRHLYRYCSRLYAIYNCVWVSPYLVRLQYIKPQTRKTSFFSQELLCSDLLWLF